MLPRKHFTAEQIIFKLRESEVELAKGRAVGQVLNKLRITQQTYYRWRKK